MVKFTRVQGLSQYEKDQEKNRQIVQSTAQTPKASTGTAPKTPSLLEQATGGSAAKTVSDAVKSLPRIDTTKSWETSSSIEDASFGGTGRGGGFGNYAGFGSDAPWTPKIKSEWAEQEEKTQSENPIVNTINKALGFTQDILNYDMRSKQISENEAHRVAIGQKNENGKNASIGEIIGNGIITGMAGAQSGFAKSVDFLIPTDFLGKYDPFSTYAEYKSKNYETLSKNQEYYSSDRGKSGEIVSNLSVVTGNALMTAVMALLNPGAAASSGLTGGASTLSSTISSGLKSIASNPMYWNSFLSTVGNEYEEAKKAGGSDWEASLAAITSSLLNSVVEIGGGIETLPGNIKLPGVNKLLTWFKSGTEEGAEEVIQRLISGVTQKAIADPDKQYFSLSDESAIVNPKAMATDFGYGTGVGLVLGGGQMLSQSALNRSRGQTNTQPGQYAPEQAETPTQTQQGGNVQTVQPESVLDKAAAEFNQRGAVSNNTATAILNDPAAVSELQQDGLTLTDGMTQSQRRAAVKETVARMQGPDATFSTGAQAVLDVLNGRQDVEQAPADTTTAYQPPEAVQTVLDVLEGRTTQEQPTPDAGLTMDAMDQAAQTGETTSVGAAPTGFTTSGFQSEERISKSYEHMPYTKAQQEATALSKEEYDNIFRYHSQSEAQSQYLAEELLYLNVDGKRTFLKDYDPSAYQGIVDSLTDATAWNGPQTDAAYMIRDELQWRSIEMLSTETEYIDWLKTMREHLSAGGQGVQANAKWSRNENFGSTSSDLEAWENIQASNLSDEQKQAAFQRIVEVDRRIRSVQQGDNDSMKQIIMDIGRERGVLRNVLKIDTKFKLLETMTSKALDSLSFQELQNLAFASKKAMTQDTEKVSIGQKLKTIQVLSMLSLPKTPGSNLVGNTTFYGLDVMAMRGAALIDMAVSHVTGTRSTAFDKGMINRDVMRSAVRALNQSIAEISLDVDMGNSESRYGTGSKRTFRANGGFLSRALSASERNMGYLLTATDQLYKGAAMASESQIQSMIDAGKIKTENANYAKEYAENLAKYRTFQDDSTISTAIQTVHDVLNLVGIGDSGRTIKGKKVKAFGLGDIAAPFTRVAGNLVSRGLEYSPANIVKGTVELTSTIANAVRKGDVDAGRQARAVSDFARGMTGTAVTFGLLALVKAGLIRRAEDEGNENARALNSSEGITGTQLNLDAAWRWIVGDTPEWQATDTLIDLSRIEPFNYFMNFAAELSKDTSDGIISTVGNIPGATANAFLSASAELPVMQFVGNLANDTIKYGQPFLESLSEQTANTLVSSVIPNVLRGTARSMDDRPRNVYSSGTLGGNILDSIINSIPILRETLPEVVDNYGNTKTYQGSSVAQAFNAMVNPVGVNTYQQSDVSKELADILANTNDASFYPDKSAPSSISYDKQKYTLTNDEKLAYQRIYGQTYEDAFAKAMDTEAYQSMTYDEKMRFGQELRQYADTVAKAQYFQSKGVEYDDGGVMEKVAATVDAGGTVGDYFAFNSVYSGIKEADEEANEKPASVEAIEAIEQIGVSDKDTAAALWASKNSSTKPEKNPYTGTLAQQGLTPMEIVDIIDAHKAASDMDLPPRDQAAEFSKALDGMDLTDAQYAAAMDTYGFGVYLPVEPSAYDYKTMSKSQKAVWDNWGNIQYDMDEFLELYRAMTAYDSEGNAPSKAESIEALYEKLGDRTKATRFYTQAKKKWD